MVSRVGFFLQIVFLPLVGGDYYFTYSLKSTNLTVTFEKLQVSKKMTPKVSKQTRSFIISNDKNATSEKEFVKEYKNEIIEIILGQKAFLSSTSKLNNAQINETSIVKSLPTLVNIDFKEDFGIIGIYE